MNLSRNRRSDYAALLFLCWLLSRCGVTAPDPPATMQNPLPKEPAVTETCNWNDVPLNENAPHPCSPQQPSDIAWRGIVINAPKQVRFSPGQTVDEYGAFAAIPLCGYRLLNVSPVPIHENMQITAVDTTTGTVYKGDIVLLDPSPIEPPPVFEDEEETPVDPEQFKNLAHGSYMNPNLANFVPIPQESATYEVFISYRGFQSNTVVIELIKE